MRKRKRKGIVLIVDTYYNYVGDNITYVPTFHQHFIFVFKAQNIWKKLGYYLFKGRTLIRGQRQKGKEADLP